MFPQHRLLTLVATLTLTSSGLLHAEDKTWLGGTTAWDTGTNWSPSGAPSTSDNLILGTAPTGTTIDTTGANRQVANIVILDGAPTYTIQGNRPLAFSQLNVGAGVTTQQNITSTQYLRYFGTASVNHLGTGLLNVFSIQDTNDASTVGNSLDNLTFTGDGDGTVGSLRTATRALRFTYNSTGTWAITDIVDFRLGGDFNQFALMTINSGTLNVSQMNLNFEYATAPSLASYTLLTYSAGATLITNSGSGVVFETISANDVAGLPTGYTIVHDTTARTISLVAVPEPGPAAMAPAGGLLLLSLLRRRGRRRATT
jgi:hypothetical protein